MPSASSLLRSGGPDAARTEMVPASETEIANARHQASLELASTWKFPGLSYLIWARSASISASTLVLSKRSEEHTSELQSLMRISYAVFCLKKKNSKHQHPQTATTQTHVTH